MLNGIFDQANLLEKGLDAAWKKNEVIANNIANSDTVDFKASHVEFESVFRKLLDTDSNSFFSTNASGTSQTESLTQEFGKTVENQTYGSSSVAGNSENIRNAADSSLSTEDSLWNITQNKDTSQANGNNVDLDSEMSELAQNSILYNTLSYSVTKELARIKIILNEGR